MEAGLDGFENSASLDSEWRQMKKQLSKVDSRERLEKTQPKDETKGMAFEILAKTLEMGCLRVLFSQTLGKV